MATSYIGPNLTEPVGLDLLIQRQPTTVDHLA